MNRMKTRVFAAVFLALQVGLFASGRAIEKIELEVSDTTDVIGDEVATPATTRKVGTRMKCLVHSGVQGEEREPQAPGVFLKGEPVELSGKKVKQKYVLDKPVTSGSDSFLSYGLVEVYYIGEGEQEMVEVIADESLLEFIGLNVLGADSYCLNPRSELKSNLEWRDVLLIRIKVKASRLFTWVSLRRGGH
jgi:hypothetical protein